VANAVGIVEARLQAARLHDLIQLKGKLCLVSALTRKQQDPAARNGTAQYGRGCAGYTSEAGYKVGVGPHVV
jgi:hypothetical protein